MNHPSLTIPTRFTHGGLIIPRTASGDGSEVVGDPCIVHDEAIGGYRMFLFFAPPGHGQAICRSKTAVGPGQWELAGPLVFTNPAAATDGTTHKPYVVQEAHRPNHPALIKGRYCLVSVGHTPGGTHKYIHRAWATALAGPWMWEAEPLIPVGGPADFDGKHTDAVSGFYFPERDEIVYYYMGYPLTAQPRIHSPFGNAQGVAVQKTGAPHVVRHGEYLAPSPRAGHWASGWLGGMQLLPGRTHRWIGLLNASPTAPDPGLRASWTEEPAPSLGGFAWCDEEFPIANWHFADRPIAWLDELPAEALANGEGTNLWRHHLLLLPDGRQAIFYNSGYYGKEQLYMIWADG